MRNHLSSSNSTTLTSPTRSRAQMSILTTNNRLRLLYNLLALGKDQLDVARVRHVWVDLDRSISICPAGVLSSGDAYTTMGTVCSSTLLGSLVDLDVLDDQVAGIQTLGISIGLSILEQTEEELGRLDRPSCTRDAELLSCRAFPSAPIINLRTPSQIAPQPRSFPCEYSYLVRHVQFHQRISSWARPPCAG